MKRLIASIMLIISSLNVKSKEIHDLTIRLTYVDDYKDIPINSGFNYPKYIGLGYPDKESGICYVYVKKPSSAEDYHKMEVLGHEIFHCTDGKFHK